LPNLPLIPKSGFPRVLALEVVALLAVLLAAIPFAVWRQGRSTAPLVALLTLLVLALVAAAAALAAWRGRRRLPRLESRQPPLGQRLAHVAPEGLAALACALVLLVPGPLPPELVAASGIVMPLEALALLGACLLVPVLRARMRRLGDAAAFGLIALLGAALAHALAERVGVSAYVVFATLVLWRGWSLVKLRRREPANEQERWLLALAVLGSSYWLATLLHACVPLPPAGWLMPARGATMPPDTWVLLWGLVHFAALALAGSLGWPAPRVELEPPPPPRAFARGRTGPK
jgi:hypothetical protein